MRRGRCVRATRGVTLCDNAYEAAEGADALLIVTEWKEFRSPDFERLKKVLGARASSMAAICMIRPCWHASGSSMPESVAAGP